MQNVPIVMANHLSKAYPVALKEPGLAGTLKHFLARKYQHIEAVRGVSFSIEAGEVVGFLGPNGAGKTTTLKMLTGLIHPSSGELHVAGHTPFKREAAFLRKITLVMGNKQQLLWDLPAADSFSINGAVYEIGDSDLHKRVGELAEMLSISDKLNQPVRKLSLGERMKAELLASLLHQPKVLFLDEPTLGLDVNAQTAVREFLREYNQRYGATLMLTSHYMADITALCQRVLMIHQGRLIYDGGLDGLLERFAPYREVRLELQHPSPPQALEKFGEVAECEGQRVRLLVRREHLVHAVNQLLSELAVLDLEVREPAVEEVIGKVFADGKVYG